MAAAVQSSMEIDNRYEASELRVTSSREPASNKETYSPELLQMYYARLFPFSLLHNWLSYGKKSSPTFKNREFSFTIEPVPGEEIYIRYQSFPSEEELAQAVVKRRPTKIDIGAVFSHPPKDHNTVPKGKFVPSQRELVFDIDLTDYDEIRQCGCSGAQICRVCWGFMKMAVSVMDQGLREDFGFQDIAWFYSGRRGVHAWVCDESARELTDEGRSAVANYFEVDLGSDKNSDVDLPHPLHPMLQRAFHILEPMFIEQVIPASGHGLLANSDKWTNLLQLIPDAAAPIREKLLPLWTKSKSTPEEKWTELKNHISLFLRGTSKAGTNKALKSITLKDRNRLENWPAEVVFRYTYPRLDINVSKMRNHLLKSPFCVHPKTGRVCVPIRASAINEFDPFAVPTLNELMNELHQNDDTVKVAFDWQRTSLKEYFEPFQKEFMEPLIRRHRRQDRDAAEQEAAVTGNF